MNSFYIEKMNELEADGIDFISIGSFDEKFPNVVASYTRTEIKNIKTIPRTGYKFWKLINGKKVYIVV